VSKLTMTLDSSVKSALLSIKQFNYTADRVSRRWKVSEIKQFMEELGMKVDSGENEHNMALRLIQAIKSSG